MPVRFRDESGFTMIEMFVVLALLAVVLAFVLQSVASFQRAATGGIRRLENLDEGRLMMQVLTRDVRTAVRLDETTPPFVKNSGNLTYTLADDNSVEFYANFNLTASACPKIVRISLASQRVTERTFDPTGGSAQAGTCTWAPGYPNTPTRTRVVGQYVVNTISEPIFTYYWDNGGTLTAYTTGETPLTVVNGLRVAAVEVRLSIRKTTALPVARTTLINRVRLPNVYFNPIPSPS